MDEKNYMMHKNFHTKFCMLTVSKSDPFIKVIWIFVTVMMYASHSSFYIDKHAVLNIIWSSILDFLILGPKVQTTF